MCIDVPGVDVRCASVYILRIYRNREVYRLAIALGRQVASIEVVCLPKYTYLQ